MSSETRRSSNANVRIVLLVVLLGIIVAFAGSVFFSLGDSTGEEAVVENAPRNIEGILLRVSGDPANRVVLLSAPETTQRSLEIVTTGQQTQVEPAQAQTATETPVPPTETPIPIGAVTAVPLARGAAVESIIFIDYAIQPNDTLYNIATRRIDSSIALMSRFGLSSDDIVQGSVIKLPVGNPAYCPGRQPYAVGEGDTAFSVARRFNTTHEDLRNINGLDANYTIRIAEIICVP